MDLAFTTGKSIPVRSGSLPAPLGIDYGRVTLKDKIAIHVLHQAGQRGEHERLGEIEIARAGTATVNFRPRFWTILFVTREEFDVPCADVRPILLTRTSVIRFFTRRVTVKTGRSFLRQSRAYAVTRRQTSSVSGSKTPMVHEGFVKILEAGTRDWRPKEPTTPPQEAGYS
jgi:hypothetical protein